MRKSGILLTMLLFLSVTACHHDKAYNMGEIAAAAAKNYYDELLQGHYDEYVDGTFYRDSIPDVYRKQLIANAKMFIGQQNEEHQGIKDISISHATADTTQCTADVFLVLKYGDKTKEKIVVPMIECHGKWKMK
jgi:hypothetical protein